jgi:peptidoglycan/LPS O-acetylase OafA/YrhL
MSSENLKSGYLPYIDGMRAVAVLAVIIYHLHAAWLPGGFAGVDVFFVISGFVVSASVVRFSSTSFRQFLLQFYARRIQRIVPALMLCLLVTALLSALFIPSAWLSNKNQYTGLAAFFGFSNFVLAQSGNDYFSPTAEFNPFTHTWSLGVEEQFYLIFPLLFFPWLRGGLSRSRSMLGFAVAALLSLAVGAWLGRAAPQMAFYMIVSRFWELAGGVLLFHLIAARGAPQPGATAYRVGPWLSLLLLASGLVFSQPGDFPFPGALPAVLGTLGLLYFLYNSQPDTLLVRVLTSAPALFFGKISYSLYLWHWPVFVLFKWTIGIESPLSRAVALLLALLLALISYHLVETPIRHSSLLQSLSRGRRVMAGFALIAVCFSVSVLITKGQSHLSQSTVTRHVGDWDPHLYQLASKLGDCRLQASTTTSHGAQILQMSRRDCAAPPKPLPAMYVIGDSHAGHYNVMLAQFVLQTGREVAIYSTGGCAVLGLREPMTEGDRCARASTAALDDLLTRVKPGDTVLFSSLRLPRLGDQWIRYDEQAVRSAAFGAGAEHERLAAQAQAETMLQRFAAKGADIVFPGPTPVFRSPAFRCSDWFNSMNPICADGSAIARTEIERYRAPVLQSLAEIGRTVPGVRVWDAMSILCPGAQCTASRDGQPLFFDGDHLSAHANTLLLPDFLRFNHAVSGTGNNIASQQNAAVRGVLRKTQ